jgi:uracil-DNA glycosylase
VQQFVDDIVSRAQLVQDALRLDPRFTGLVGRCRTIPRPFMGRGPIRLVVVGQDPTVQKESSRGSITTVLNLDRAGSLRAHIDSLCKALGVDLNSEVYATNLAKGFFTDPPTKILKNSGRDVLAETSTRWMPLLRDELAQLPGALVVSLGEPLLPVLIAPGNPNTMRHYWGWQRDWKLKGCGPFVTVNPKQSNLGRIFFPFVHQPTMRGSRSKFYRCRMDEYMRFMRTSLAGL